MICARSFRRLRPRLKILASTILDHSKFTQPQGTIALPPSWKPTLDTLIWKALRENLVCNDALLKCLQTATVVEIYGTNIQSSWVVKFLASNPNLQRVAFPLGEMDEVDDMPELNLPSLESLSLSRAPKSTASGDSKGFFKNFDAPNLQALHLRCIHPDELCFLKSNSTPRELTIPVIEGLSSTSDPEEAQQVASRLVHSIEKWDRLTKIRIKDLKPTAFFNHFFRLLMPMSRECIQGGYKDQVLLPGLEAIDIECFKSTKSTPPISDISLASLVASRLAVSRELSSSQVLLSASGHLESCLEEKTDEKTPFKADQICSRIYNLKIDLAIRSDRETFSFLHASGWFISKFGPQP